MAIFKFVLPDDILRKMNKQEYKATMHWLRFCRREVEKKIDWDKFDRVVMDKLMCYGYCDVSLFEE